ncbi:ABC-F family ATP-binding cassette domain-containing protein [Flavihumibacter sp. RY-1]|uniref:ABC-F family ATP-binding cassette domain-containing protein n=1 Tax=Flavihumibacter fluminis TaxID=2909236 RepID=A0ABS9BCJ8_9BACT|nr:ABC-F family ATP-binding cassette domain-containing protein [Flavihumibacter fluminis]MCF1713382.1 ABC-F family ATP-binding cassette domain-containing protein [Flavihumibacter fluminis]
MHYVSAEGLGKSYGIKPLFENISFHIEEGDKIALIARNGSGKSTLLKILAGRETPDNGTCWIHKDVTVALFDQEPEFREQDSILDNIFHHEHPTLNAIKAYEAATELENAVLLNAAIEKMDETGGWDFEAKVKQILGKLNIHQLNQVVGTLSGGQRKRVALARTLIDIGFDHKHTLLIMDEPTNHLDIQTVEWLEHFLNQEKVTLLLVTHDRYFLDAVCEEIWELDGSELYTYKGDYETYMERKAARMEQQAASVDKARNVYRKELEWMRKQPKARTTKSKSRIDAFADVEAKAKQRLEEQALQLQMKMNRLGGKVIELKKIYKKYDDKEILKGFDYTFKKGDRIGIVGPNGVGKTTFLNILQGIEEADSGKVNIGETIVFGYFSQQGLTYKEDMRVIEYVKTFAENFPLANGGSLSAAQFLQLFLFTPDQQYSYISALSGGEKKRLLLLTILFRNPNFLILDEPTNDLDLPTLAVLENFLSEFQGCLLIVSHDRYFMDRLVDHLFVFEGNGHIRDFPGNYTIYRIWQKEQEQKTITATVETASKQIVQQPAAPQAAKKKLSFNEKREFEQLEKDIPKLEKEKAALSEKLASGKLEFQELQEISLKIGKISEELEEKEMRWLELSEMTGA